VSNEREVNQRAIALLDRYVPGAADDEQRRLAGEIKALLHESADDLDDDVLLTILDLPGGPDADPLIEAAMKDLWRRGPGVVETLLTTALDGGENAEPRALELLERLDEADVVQGMVEVLGGDAQGFVKRAAADALVAVGESAVDPLKAAAESPRSQRLALEALDRLGVAYEPTTVYADTGDADESWDEQSDEEAEGEAPDGAADTAVDQAIDESGDVAIDEASDQSDGEGTDESETKGPTRGSTTQ
jgi:hypothetical protein